MGKVFGRAPSEAGYSGSAPSPTVSASGEYPSRKDGAQSSPDLWTLYEECRGWHSALDSGRVGDGAFTIRSENGDSEQVRLNLRATLWDVAIVIAAVASASGIEVPQGPEPKGPAEGESPARRETP